MKLMSIKEVAKFLKVKEPTLYSWVRNGAIPSYKLRGLLRFDMAEIIEWVKESKQRKCNVKIRLKRAQTQDINGIIKKVIDEARAKGYNPRKRETRPTQGLRKEVTDGGF